MSDQKFGKPVEIPSSRLQISLDFVQPLIGTASTIKALQAEHIASQAPTTEMTQEELDSLPDLDRPGTTFPKDDKGLRLWDYQIQGFLKEAIGILVELGAAGTLTKWTFKRVVDGCLFVHPRRIYLMDKAGNHLTQGESFTRSLRAETMQGDRICLVTSDLVPEGTTCKFELTFLKTSNKKSKYNSIGTDLIRTALDYGLLRGIGQWRNGSFGRFNWTGIEQSNSKAEVSIPKA